MFKKMMTSLTAIVALALAGATLAKDEMPDRTEDGLMRIDSKNVEAVYWLEGATLEGYNSILIMDPQVAFRKNWQRDYNRTTMPGVSRRVTPDDMERIKQGLADEFISVFQEVLGEAGYGVVDAPAEDVLVLRPAIVNLDVTAPDLETSMRDRTYVASAGQMTLYMDLFDSVTGAKIGTVIDGQRARDTGTMTWSSGMKNKQEARRILRKWSGLLAAALDEAHKKGD